MESQKRKFEKIMKQNKTNEEKTSIIFNELSLLRQTSTTAAIHAYKNFLSIEDADKLMRARYISNDENIFKISQIHTIEKETSTDVINWVTTTLSYFSNEINEFLVMRNKFVKSLMNSSFSEAAKLLDEIEHKFGKTFWSLTNKMILVYFKKDLAEFNRISKEMQLLEHSYSKSRIGYEVVRCNRNISAERYVFSIGKMIEEVRLDGVFHAIDTICYRHLFDPSANYESIINIYKNDYDIRIIDQYISYLRFVLYLKNCNLLSDESESTLEQLTLIIDDKELKNLVSNMRNFNGNRINEGQVLYQKIIMLYLEESYEEVVNLCERTLVEEPNLSVIYIPYAKSLIQLGKYCSFNNVLGEVINLIINITLDNDTENSLAQLMKISQVLNDYNWSFILNCVLASYNGEGDSNTHKKYSFVDLCSLNNNIMDLDELSKDIINNESIPEWRKNKYTADHLYHLTEYEQALKYYKMLNSRDESYARSKIIQCYYKLGNTDKANEIMATELLKETNPKTLPIKIIVNDIIKNLTFTTDNNKLLNSAIILHYYNQYISNDYTQPLSDICENYFNNLGIFEHHEIKFENPNINTFLLERILNLEVLDGMSTFFNTDSEVLLFRVSINRILLSNLASYNIEKRNFIFEEARSLLNKIVINLCSHEAGAGRIYIDKTSIRNKINDEVKNDLDILKKYEERDLSYQIQDADEESDALFYSSDNEFFNGVMALLYKITNAYTLDKLYGLDQSLNMGIRHGGFVNLLWAPLKRNNISAKKHDENKFSPNPVWRTDFGYFKDSILDGIDNALVEFNKKANAIINQAKNKVHIDTGEFGYNSKLFEFSLEPDYQASVASRIDSLSAETLIDDVFLYLDKQTNEKMAIARGEFVDSIEKDMFEEIKNLKDKLESDGLDVIAIQRAVSKSKDELKESFIQLRTWFDWAKQTKTNFDLNVALKKAESAASQYYPWLKFNLSGYNNSTSNFLGQYFTDTVMILTLIIDNALKHSNPRDNYHITYNINEHNNSLQLSFTNTLDFDLQEEQCKKIVQINEDLAENRIDNSTKDNGSGIYKVKKIITHHLKVENKVTVVYSNKKFEVLIIIEDIEPIKEK